MKNINEEISIPLWFLWLEKKYLRYQSKFAFFYVLIIFIVLGIVLLLSPEYSLTLENQIIIGFSYFLVLSIISILIWCFYYKPNKLSIEEILSYNFYKVGNNLKILNLNRELVINLKNNLRILIINLKTTRRKYKKSAHSNLVDSINDIINNLMKLNDYSSEKVFDKIKEYKFYARFHYISNSLYKNKELINVKSQLLDLGNDLKNLEKIKILDKTKPIFSYFRDYFPILGIIITIIFGICYYFTQYPLFLAIFSGLLGVWLIVILKK